MKTAGKHKSKYELRTKKDQSRYSITIIKIMIIR